MLPPIPSWDTLHVLIVHLPIALLLVAPIFLVLAMAVSVHRRAFALSALILMVLGTAAAFVAVSTGQAAGELADKTEATMPVIEQHEEMGETTRNVFTALTVLYALILFGPAVLKKELGAKAFVLTSAVYLVLYLVGVWGLINTGHLGGRLVHEFGIRALM
ncbi:MAG TPA: hypothetical protein PLY66_09025 [Acidobacteriota bacterium]|nr:hypothetical protein [Acidobacteriota bacterium]HQF85945.1 hypothetical protein [Acidobacteriota bacterium]HQG90811.1 hypothetical protein [Acidobacteriota bacterium]HQK87300.1 hypothetical protein [Acidobacteriota bacterium]